MGLDMYLSKRTYVKQWDFQKPEERHSVIVSKGGEVLEAVKPERVSYVIEEVGYWRKFNALHQWFVDHVQGGEDNCKEHYVDTTDLEVLLETLKMIQKDHSLAKELLPAQAGFFFGSTDYDEYYYKDVDETVELLTNLLQEDSEGGYYYQSSW